MFTSQRLHVSLDCRHGAKVLGNHPGIRNVYSAMLFEHDDKIYQGKTVERS